MIHPRGIQRGPTLSKRWLELRATMAMFNNFQDLVLVKQLKQTILTTHKETRLNNKSSLVLAKIAMAATIRWSCLRRWLSSFKLIKMSVDQGANLWLSCLRLKKMKLAYVKNFSKTLATKGRINSKNQVVSGQGVKLATMLQQKQITVLMRSSDRE